MGSRPVPVSIMAELTKYASGLDIEKGKIFSDNFNQKKMGEDTRRGWFD